MIYMSKKFITIFLFTLISTNIFADNEDKPWNGMLVKYYYVNIVGVITILYTLVQEFLPMNLFLMTKR